MRATRVRTAVCVRMGLRASPVSVRKTRQVRGKNFPSGKSCGYRWPEMGRAVLSKYYVIMFTYEVARLQAESLLKSVYYQNSAEQHPPENRTTIP